MVNTAETLQSTSMTFVSKTAYENGINRALNLKRMVRPVKNIRQLSKADMKITAQHLN